MKQLSEISNYLQRLSARVIPISLQFLCFILPLNTKYAPYFISVLLITGIVNIFKAKTKAVFTKTSVFLLLFYCFLIIGLVYTENLSVGFFDLEVKASLLIFPLLFTVVKLSKAEFPKLVKALVYGIFVFFLIAIFNSTSNYMQNGGVHHFLYTRLSTVVHPSYMSMYITTAIAFTLYYLKSEVYLFFSKTGTLLLLLLLFSINIMVLSKVGIVVSILILGYYIFSTLFILKKYAVGIGLIFSVCLLFTVTYKNVEYFAQRIDEFVLIFDKQNSKSDKSSSVRLEIWEQAMILIKEKPLFGHGTGDVKAELIEKYIENDILYAAKKQYNAHNQFLQIIISSGLVGLTLFLLSFYFGIKSNHLFLIFTLILFSYLSVESILENQAGTIFFGLFFSLLSQKSFHETPHSDTVLSA